MRVLVILEDSRGDKELLKPLVEAFLLAAGRKQARVRICEDPVLGGVSEALKWDRIREILDQYRMVDVFILVIDRDGDTNRRARLDALEQKSAALLKPGRFGATTSEVARGRRDRYRRRESAA